MPATAVLTQPEPNFGLARALITPVPQRPRERVMTLVASSQAVAMTDLLVKIARDRDKQAFASLFAYYAPRVKGYLIRQGADDGTAEELAQEALLTAWRKADRFDPTKASAGTWIFTVARNLRIDALRKGRRPEFDPEDPAFVPDPAESPDAAIQADQTRVRIRKAMADLPEEQATVIRLSFFEDKPHGEIAEQLGLPLGTVKSRLRLAMRRIKSSLGE